MSNVRFVTRDPEEIDAHYRTPSEANLGAFLADLKAQGPDVRPAERKPLPGHLAWVE